MDSLSGWRAWWYSREEARLCNCGDSGATELRFAGTGEELVPIQTKAE